MDLIFQIAILLMSVVIHEVSHGYAALALGDPTAKYEGRLTLNPIKHLDPFGSFILPLISYMTGGFLIGWAKPVPYNPYNLRPGRWSEALVALAGPASNISIALIFGLILHILPVSAATAPFAQIVLDIILVNLVLAVFNMVPIPPLDGSKLLFALLPDGSYAWRRGLERHGMWVLIFFVFFLWQYIFPIAGFFFRLITGIQA